MLEPTGTLVTPQRTLPAVEPALVRVPKMRAYVATNWFDVVEVLGYTVKQNPYYKGPKPEWFVDLLVDNNGAGTFRVNNLPVEGFTTVIGGAV